MNEDMLLLECQRLAEIAQKYNGQCHTLFDQLSQEVVREEYAVGGEVLHRGFYCPSPILDIILGNAKRGRLLKRLTVRSKPTYKYGFNKENRLITIEIPPFNKEILWWEKGIETGVLFSERWISVLSQCVYSEGRIQSYVCGLYNPYEKKITEFTQEIYTYEEHGLKTVDWIRCTNFPFISEQKKNNIQHEKFSFQHDAEGYLSHYTSAEYNGEKIKDSVWKDHVFDVDVKRKV